jgi:hypothetical protein
MAAPTPCTARDDKDQGVGSQRTGARRGGENSESRHEHAFRAQSIAKSTGGQDHGREHGRVAVDDPLQFGDAHTERLSDAAQRGVYDGDVELHDAKSQADRRQCQWFRGSSIARPPRLADNTRDTVNDK